VVKKKKEGMHGVRETSVEYKEKAWNDGDTRYTMNRQEKK
jgi:hypothetical protein